MAKITLPTIAAGFASNTAFNTAYDLIEAEFQNKVLYRNNTSGETNTMQQALDMDGEAINNCGVLTATGLTVAGVSLTTKVAEAAASATAAASSATAAASSATAAAASYDSFDDRYLGAKGSAPTVDNDGGALLTGAIYFNTSSNQIFAWTAGDAWVAIKPTSSEQTAITAVAADATDIGVVAGKATEIGRLGTSAAVADMAILATDAIVADMALLATDAIVADMALLASDAVIADMAILGTSDVVTDMNVLGTADVVNDMNILGSSAVVTDMNLLGTSANVTAMGLLGTSTVIANIATVSANVAGVNSFADLYRGALAEAPSGTITTGSLYYNTGSDKLFIWTGSAWSEAAFSISGTVTAFNSRTGAVTLTSADVTGALSTGAIATAKIADDAITTDKLANSINSAITANTAKTGITGGQASAITANTAKVTNATHTGDVTGATALTIGNDKVITDKILDSNVTTAKIADNAITLAKMASGTDGNIISYDASGNPVAVATGSDGQVLTSTGAGSPPVFEDAASGVPSSMEISRTITGATTIRRAVSIATNGSVGTLPTINTLGSLLGTSPAWEIPARGNGKTKIRTTTALSGTNNDTFTVSIYGSYLNGSNIFVENGTPMTMVLQVVDDIAVANSGVTKWSIIDNKWAIVAFGKGNQYEGGSPPSAKLQIQSIQVNESDGTPTIFGTMRTHSRTGSANNKEIQPGMIRGGLDYWSSSINIVDGTTKTTQGYWFNPSSGFDQVTATPTNNDTLYPSYLYQYYFDMNFSVWNGDVSRFYWYDFSGQSVKSIGAASSHTLADETATTTSLGISDYGDQPRLHFLDSSHLLFMYRTTASKPVAKTYSFSGTTFTLIDTFELPSDFSVGPIETIQQKDSKNLVMGDGGTGGYVWSMGLASDYTINGTSVFMSVYNNGLLFARYTGASDIFRLYTVQGSDPKIRLLTVNAYSTSRFTYGGIATATASSGSTPITIGGVVGGYSSLTTGTDYHVADSYDGQLSTSTSLARVGVAISPTEILLGEVT